MPACKKPDQILGIDFGRHCSICFEHVRKQCRKITKQISKAGLGHGLNHLIHFSAKLKFGNVQQMLWDTHPDSLIGCSLNGLQHGLIAHHGWPSPLDHNQCNLAALRAVAGRQKEAVLGLDNCFEFGKSDDLYSREMYRASLLVSFLGWIV